MKWSTSPGLVMPTTGWISRLACASRGAEGQFLMGAVQRVAGPGKATMRRQPSLGNGAQLVRRVAAAAEIVMRRLLDAGDRAAQIDGPGVVQIVHGRMGQIIGAEHLSASFDFVRVHLSVTDRMARMTPSRSRSAMSRPGSTCRRSPG